MKAIVLIGMPGAGKSTVGVLLAKQLGLDFVDTDVLIQVKAGRTLQQIMEQQGYLALRNLEEQTLLNLSLSAIIVATGGSAVYGDEAMSYLQANAQVVFIDVSLAELNTRIHNYADRGIARRPDQSFSELFEERHRLYKKYADIVIAGDGMRPDQVVGQLARELDNVN